MPLFGPPNIDTLKAQGNTQALIKALKPMKGVDRTQVVDALVEIGEPAVDALIAAIDHKNSDVRYASANALGKIGAEEAVGPLLILLKDDDGLVSSSAATALGEIGDEWAVMPLIAALQTRRFDSITHHLWIDRVGDALVEIGPPAVEPLLALLQNEDQDQQHRGRAARILGKIGDARAIEPLVDAASDIQIHQAAADTLCAIGEPAVELLFSAMMKEELTNYDLGPIATLVQMDFASILTHMTTYRDTNGGMRGLAFATLLDICRAKAFRLFNKYYQEGFVIGGTDTPGIELRWQFDREMEKIGRKLARSINRPGEGATPEHVADELAQWIDYVHLPSNLAIVEVDFPGIQEPLKAFTDELQQIVDLIRSTKG